MKRGEDERTSTDALNGDGLRSISTWGEDFLRRVESSIEEGVDECRFS